MADGPEKRLEKRIVSAISREWPGSFVLKVHGGAFQTAGIPDLLVVMEGRLVGIEVKARRPGESIERLTKRVSWLQWGVIDNLRAAGAVAGVVWTVEDALALVRASLSGEDYSSIGLTRPRLSG